MATIRDIAKKAQVSTATVSYVLNDSAQISEETREKVLKAVRELNYSPNNIAKSLKIKKTNTIGIITEDITVFNSPEIVDGINKYMEEQGYHIILNNLRLFKRLGNNFWNSTKYVKKINEIISVLLSRQIDGIIYIGAHTRDVSDIIKDINIPIVYTYCYSSGELDYSVNYDDQLGAYEATEYLIKLGHKRIGVITGLVDSIPCQERLKGYQKALEENNLIFNPSYIKVGDWEYESGYENAKELLSKKDRTTAIFAMNDLMAGGVIDAAREMGINIPKDLSLIGYDNRECSFFYVPKLTTVGLPLSEMGERSAKILIDLIDKKNTEETSIKIKCSIVERESAAENSI